MDMRNPLEQLEALIIVYRRTYGMDMWSAIANIRADLRTVYNNQIQKASEKRNDDPSVICHCEQGQGFAHQHAPASSERGSI